MLTTYGRTLNRPCWPANPDRWKDGPNPPARHSCVHHPMCFSPGPNNVLCAAHGSQHGFKATLTLISGMAVGWSTLGLFVRGYCFHREQPGVLRDIDLRRSRLHCYLSLRSRLQTLSRTVLSRKSVLDSRPGLPFSSVNGKAWIHFLVLMTTFGSLFGTGFSGKAMLVIMNVLFGLPAVMTWAAFGTVLRRAFTTPRSATLLNRGMGLSLFAVSLWIVIPSDYYSGLLG